MWWCKAHAEGGYKSNSQRSVHTRGDNYKNHYNVLNNYPKSMRTQRNDIV